MLSVSPKDFLTFPRGDPKETVLELTCTTWRRVSFKIKTTSPEKFRAQPRYGLLEPGQSVSVNIRLRTGQHLSNNAKDKFLIMCLPSMNISASQVASFWKTYNTNLVFVEQHKVRCIYCVPAIVADADADAVALAGAVGYDAGAQIQTVAEWRLR